MPEPWLFGRILPQVCHHRLITYWSLARPGRQLSSNPSSNEDTSVCHITTPYVSPLLQIAEGDESGHNSEEAVGILLGSSEYIPVLSPSLSQR